MNKSNAGLIECIQECFLFLYFLEETVENWYNLFLKYLAKFTSEAGPGDFIFGRLLIINSIYLIKGYSGYFYLNEFW